MDREAISADLKKKQESKREDLKRRDAAVKAAVKPADKPKAEPLTAAGRSMRDAVRKHKASVRRPLY